MARIRIVRIFLYFLLTFQKYTSLSFSASFSLHYIYYYSANCHYYFLHCFEINFIRVSGGELFDKIQEVEFYSEKDGSKILEALLRVILHCHERGKLNITCSQRSLTMHQHIHSPH